MTGEQHHAGGLGEPGGRLRGEPDKAYRAFSIYRDLGSGRSLDAAARRLRGQAGDKPGTAPKPGTRARTRHIQEWSVAWRWVERARAWDAHLDRQAREAQATAIRHMNHRHALAGRAVQAKAVEALRALAAGAMSPADIVRAMVEGTKLERLALGQVTDAVRQEVEGNERVTLEVVERIVPVRGDGAVPAHALPAAGRPRDEAPEFDLPAEPPAAPPRR